MRNLTCDICGVSAVHLNDLLDIYKVDGIAEVCDSCEKTINAHHNKLMDITLTMKKTWLKAFLQNLRKALKSAKE